MMSRRLLVLACLFLAVVLPQTVSGQEGGVVENIALDEVVDAVADGVEGGAGVSGALAADPDEEGGGDSPVAVGDRQGEEGEDEDLEDVYEEAEDDVAAAAKNAVAEAGAAADTARDAAAETAAHLKAASASEKATRGASPSASGDGFLEPLFKKRPKRGNQLCSWSWKERRCEPAALCQYKYQFLDATVSESCRLAGVTAKRGVFEHADIRTKPTVALLGAAGLFSADLLAIRYTNWLERSPLLFNVVQGFVLLFSGDTLFQVLEQGWEKVVGLKFWRMVRSGVIGALNNGLIHYSYYKWIDKRFPYEKFTEKRWGSRDGTKYKLAVGLSKWAIEWPTIGLYKIASMYILTAVLSGDTKGLWARIQDSLVLTWLRSLQVWPIYDTMLYAYVPTAHRPLFNSFMSIVWGGYLSHISQPHEGEEEDVPVEAS